jgi:hypothetical protein
MRRVRPLVFVAAVAVVVLIAACAPTSSTRTAGSTEPPASLTPTGAAAASGPPSGSPAPQASGGFAFDAESILGYYGSLGYACAAAQPSTRAAGYSVRSCQLVDTNGRTRVVGIVTDPADDVADAYASVGGTSSETVLEPSVALEPLAAFLGATLGASQGEAELPWLAGHLGDAYVTTTVGDLTLATYSASADDHSKLYVELANRAYLEAPTPGPT